jgi:predicted ATP-grasp superfamily ATP-dependent carboligase
MGEYDVILIGASVRAAACSAVRAGLRPWCADLFADEDLQRLGTTRRIEARSYPRGFLKILQTAPDCPWSYTGALENRPAIVDRLARHRPLWGNRADVLRRVRSPQLLMSVFRQHRIRCPSVTTTPPTDGQRWLRKPLHSAAGLGISVWDLSLVPKLCLGTHGQETPFLVNDSKQSFENLHSQTEFGSERKHNEKWYFQSFIEGTSYSAVFVGESDSARLLGVTRQLVGEPWLDAGPFRYCGSIGPLTISATAQRMLEQIGDILASIFALRGLFGVDFILQGDVPYPVEVNPRYTASVEVIELATGQALLDMHRRAFSPTSNPVASNTKAMPGVVGKAILFARNGISFPAIGPWRSALDGAFDPWEVPACADIPAAGSIIEPGQPILSIFASGADEAECAACLHERAAALESTLLTAS